MTQHSFVEPNEAGAAYRSGMNTALQALASLSSGASEPSTRYPYQLWADTTSGLLKIRNAANSAWITLGALDGSSWLTSILATLASPVFTGNPTAPTPAFGDNDTSIATTAFVQGRSIVKRKTADESVTSSVALQDDDHLTFAIAANEEWTANCDLYWNGATAGGIRVAVTVPSGASLLVSGSFFGVGASSTDNRFGATLTSGTAFIIFNPATDTEGLLKLSIWVLNSTNAGSVTLQWAQAGSSGTPSKLLKGSFLQATRVA
jgi:hypothetical protein